MAPITDDSKRTRSESVTEYSIPVSVRDGKSSGFECAANRFVLVIVSSGSMIIKTADRTVSVTSPGCICLNETENPVIIHDEECAVSQVIFHPTIISGVLTFENIRDTRESMSFAERQDGDFLKPFISRDKTFSGFIPYGPGTNERIHDLLKNMRRELNTKPDRFWPCRSRSFFLEIVFLVFKLYSTPGDMPPAALDNAPVRNDHYDRSGSQSARIIHFINSNYDAKITVENLCEKFGISHTTLNRIVREASGMTVNKLLNRTRISAACVLLRDTKLPVVEIVYRAGFSDVSHFGRVFRTVTGLSPGDYRARYGNTPSY